MLNTANCPDCDSKIKSLDLSNSKLEWLFTLYLLQSQASRSKCIAELAVTANLIVTDLLTDSKKLLKPLAINFDLKAGHHQ